MESVWFQDMRLKSNATTRRSEPARRPVPLEDKVQRSGFVSSLNAIAFASFVRAGADFLRFLRGWVRLLL